MMVMIFITQVILLNSTINNSINIQIIQVKMFIEYVFDDIKKNRR